jgi:hypothetical protein
MNGVITYISPEHEAHTIGGAITIFGLFKAFLEITTIDRERALGEIEGDIATSIAARGII